MTPLMLTSASCFINCVKLLLEAGADQTIKLDDEYYGKEELTAYDRAGSDEIKARILCSTDYTLYMLGTTFRTYSCSQSITTRSSVHTLSFFLHYAWSRNSLQMRDPLMNEGRNFFRKRCLCSLHDRISTRTDVYSFPQ